jgi:hypothetical protein
LRCYTKQLPPVLESSRGGNTGAASPLNKGLFVRLSEAGHTPVLLRTQYRQGPKHNSPATSFITVFTLLSRVKCHPVTWRHRVP